MPNWAQNPFRFWIRRKWWDLVEEEWKEGMIQRCIFGRKVSGGQICGQRQTSGNCRTCCLCQRAQTPGPPPPTPYHMHPWLSQAASQPTRGARGKERKEGRMEEEEKSGRKGRGVGREAEERRARDEPEQTGKKQWCSTSVEKRKGQDECGLKNRIVYSKIHWWTHTEGERLYWEGCYYLREE